MNEKEKADMLRTDRVEWQALVAGLDAHPEGNLHDEGPSWNSRDVYAHIARWSVFNIAAARVVLAGQPFPRLKGAVDQINAAWHKEDQRLILQQARSWALSVFEERLRFIEAIPEEKFAGTVESIFLADGAEHYRDHLTYIAESRPRS